MRLSQVFTAVLVSTLVSGAVIPSPVKRNIVGGSPRVVEERNIVGGSPRVVVEERNIVGGSPRVVES
jgi:hypothetical protein